MSSAPAALARSICSLNSESAHTNTFMSLNCALLFIHCKTWMPSILGIRTSNRTSDGRGLVSRFSNGPSPFKYLMATSPSRTNLNWTGGFKTRTAPSNNILSFVSSSATNTVFTVGITLLIRTLRRHEPNDAGSRHRFVTAQCNHQIYDAQRVPTLEYRREVNAPVVLCRTHMFRRATCYFCVDAGIQTQDSV